MKRKVMLAVALFMLIVAADIATKRWALDTLAHGATLESAGVPLTLAFNTGIAFGLDVPSAGRWILIAASIFVLFMLVGLLHQAKHDDWLRVGSIALVGSGAIGNLIDRVRWEHGVVDFIGPIDLGFMHWPIFNVADMAITVGALALGLSLWREEPATAAAAEAAEPAGPADLRLTTEESEDWHA